MQAILDMLQGDGALAQMAKELGVDETMVSAGAAALMPALLGGFKQVAASQGGVEGLLGMVQQMGGSSLLDSVLGANPTPTAPGQQILSQIFGGGATAGAVVQQAAGSTGLSPQLLQSMLPMLAMAAAGFMSKQAAASEGGLGGLVGQVMGALTGNSQAGGIGGIAKLLDMDGDGNPLNDIMKMMGR